MPGTGTMGSALSRRWARPCHAERRERCCQPSKCWAGADADGSMGGLRERADTKGEGGAAWEPSLSGQHDMAITDLSSLDSI